MGVPCPHPTTAAPSPPRTAPSIPHPAAGRIPCADASSTHSSARCRHRCRSGQAHRCPGSPGAGRAAGSGAPAASGASCLLCSKEELAGWQLAPCRNRAGTCLPPFSLASVPNQSIVSIRSGEGFSPPAAKCYCFSEARQLGSSSSAPARTSSAQTRAGKSLEQALAQLLPAESRADFIPTAKGYRGGEDGAGTPQGRWQPGTRPPFRGSEVVLGAQVDVHVGLLSGCQRPIAMPTHIPHHAGFAASSGITAQHHPRWVQTPAWPPRRPGCARDSQVWLSPLRDSPPHIAAGPLLLLRN